MFITARIIHVASVDLIPTVQCIYMYDSFHIIILSFFSLIHSSLTGTFEPTNDQLLLNISSFIAQLVRASHQYQQVTGSNPVQVLNFSGFSVQLLKIIASLDDEFSHNYY